MSVSKYRLKQFISFAVLGAMYAAPVSAASLNRDIHNHKPIVFQQDVSKVQSKAWLIKQLTYAQLLHRPDITQTTLKRYLLLILKMLRDSVFRRNTWQNQVKLNKLK